MPLTPTTSFAADRRAGAAQGWVLVSCAWLAVMASGMLAPVLPRMTSVFSSEHHLDSLISLTATAPALFVAMLAWPFGMLGDRFGRSRVLIWAMLLYGVFGTAPQWLASLPQIVASRALVGVAEAAIMSCSTALIGSYYESLQRNKYLALQTGTAPIIAILVIGIGGALGNSNWRHAFLPYGVAFILVPLIGRFLWEPRKRSITISATPSLPLIQLAWSRLLAICAITIFAMSALMVTVIQLSFVLTERGVVEPNLLGLWSAVAALANPVGALIFGLWKCKAAPRVALCFALMGAASRSWR